MPEITVLPNSKQFKLSKIQSLQAEVSKLPQYEPETRHYFADGMYCREVFRIAGSLVVGKVHKKEHFYIVADGIVAVVTDEGMKEIEGPKVIISKPGTKRAVYALTDATCITVHRTDKTDLEEVEAELVEDDENSMYGVGNKLKNTLESKS